MVERAVIVCRDDRIQAKDLYFQPLGDNGETETLEVPTEIDADEPARGFDMSTADSLDLEGLEQEAVAEALRRSEGNQVQAAKLLDMTRFTLRRRMAQYGLDDTS
jgi:DNA-binding NtrC family response regulator